MISPIFNHGVILGHDSLTHMFRIVSLSQNINHGNIFAKIGYNYINGFGYGTGIFYPHINLYFPALIYSLTKNVSIAIKGYIYLNTFISSLIMYIFLKRKVKKNSALVGSLIYVLSPYCYVQSIFRGAIGEMSVFLSLPLIFLGLDKISKREKYGNLLLIIGGILTVQSHIISSIYVSLFTILYLIINHKIYLKKNIIIDIIKSIFAIILLSLYFIVPFLEHYYIGGYNILNSAGNPSSSIVYFSQLFFHSGVNYGNVDGYDISEEMSFVIGYIIVLLNICFPYVYRLLKRKNEHIETLSFLFIGILGIFMMCCPIVWGHFEILDIIQFPWRILSYIIFFLTVSGTIVFNKFKYNSKSFLLVLCLILAVSFIQLNPYINNTPNMAYLDFDLKKITSMQLLDKENTYLFKALGGANDYLPVETDINYIIDRGNNLIAKDDKIIIAEKFKLKNGSLSTNIKINEDSIIELPFIYYLGYDIKLNEKSIKYYKNENGFIEIFLKKNSIGKLSVVYKGTFLDIIAEHISIFSFVLLIVYYLLKKKNLKL